MVTQARVFMMVQARVSSVAQITSVRVSARNNLDVHSKSDLEILPLSLVGRLAVASKVLLITWGITILFLFIPVLHFVLVPAGILFGLFRFYRAFGFQVVLLNGSINCPKCQHAYPAKNEAFNWPKIEVCPNCQTDLTISKCS